MTEFYSLDQVRRAIRRLYETAPQVHAQLNLRSPRRTTKSFSAVIKSVYPNLFILSEKSEDKEELLSCSYVDVLTGTVEIRELTGKN